MDFGLILLNYYKLLHKSNSEATHGAKLSESSCFGLLRLLFHDYDGMERDAISGWTDVDTRANENNA